MRDSREVLAKVERGIEASSRTSATPPGQTEASPAPRDDQVEAINQVFALFRLNFHNQYYSAFPDAEQLRQVKRLWLDSLAAYPPELILRGAREAIEGSEYLPTLHRMHECCERAFGSVGIPSPRRAYREACEARSPRHEYPWSHPLAYHAGRDAGWFFLEQTAEAVSWPVFRERYLALCRRALAGETFAAPEAEPPSLPAQTPLTAEDRLAALQQLRRQHDL